MLTRLIRAADEDNRDWSAISDWAEQISQTLLPKLPHPAG